jgi:carbohydrate-binding DOMON domain-containing protein
LTSTTKIINEKLIAKPYFGNSTGAIVVSIPKKFATQCNIDTKSYVIIESQNGSITMKKLDQDLLK